MAVSSLLLGLVMGGRCAAPTGVRATAPLEVQCYPPTEADEWHYADLVGEGNQFAIAQCADGYERERGSSTYLCKAGIGWEHQDVPGETDLRCVTVAKRPARCFGAPDLGLQPRTGTRGDTVDAACAVGWVVAPDTDASSARYRCDDGPGWTLISGVLRCQNSDLPLASYCQGQPRDAYNGDAGVDTTRYAAVAAHSNAYVVAVCATGCVPQTGDSVYLCSGGSWQHKGLTIGTNARRNDLVCVDGCDAMPVENADRQCADTKAGDKCRVSCQNGYVGVGDPEINCGSDGRWESSAFRCVVECAELPPLAPHTTSAAKTNGKACMAGRRLAAGEQCSIQCLAGYQQQGGPAAYIFACTSEGSLTRPRPDCQQCPKKSFNPTRGSPTCEPCPDGCTTLGKTAQQNCSCGVSPPGPSRNRSSCPFEALTPKDHVVMSGENGGSCAAGQIVASGESCIAECGTGYFKSGGTTQYTCRQGQWTPAALNTECTADGSCEATDPNENAEWAEGCHPYRDQACVSQCKEGYQRRSGKLTLQLRCTIDGQGVGTWMPVGFNYSADTVCVACWDQHEDKPAHCYCEADPPTDNAECAKLEGGYLAGALHSECKPGCAAGYHHEEEEKPFRCTMVNGTGQWVGGSIQCLKGNKSKTVRSFGVRPEHAVLITLGVLAVLIVVVYKCLWPRFCKREVAQERLLRPTLLGGAEMMPAAKLAQVDAPARWARAQATQLQGGSGPSDVPVNISHGHLGGSESSARYRQHKGTVRDLQVMFHNDHVDELRPRDWRKSTIGRGGSGSVHMASWRGQELAVKIITLPPEPEAPGDKVRPLLKRTLQKITDSFVAEVEICCDLVHPNVVKLIGYATEPHLMLVQELMRGGSIDNQLYQQGWRPSHAQVHKVALDVARGMAFLHTAFQDTARHEQDKAIIHRDLKSANLMLSAPPPTSKEVGNLLVKISDFGLSKDKQTDAQHHTMKMTAVGGGTTLWMAPEMLEEKAYNEKIDVYSFAMCLIELVDGQLPWTNCCAPAMVATKVTQGEMRLLEPQLASAEPEVAQMVRECWAPDPNERPKFPDIVTRLEALMGIEASQNTALTQTVTRPEPSPPPGPLMEGGRSFVRSKVEKSTEEDRATWQEVQARVSESLPEYRVVRIDRLQNLELWRHYFLFCFDLESATHGSGVNERRLFHWAPPEVFEMISGKDGSGFETRLARGGEYGDGAYFAQHAIYPLAYRTNSCRNREVHAALDWTVPQEPGTRISLLWARVALGNVCDFGARCASSRGNSAAKAAGEPPGLHGDWPMDVPRGAKQGHRQRPPPLKKPAWTGIQRARKDAVVREEGTYNSVSGTEANLEWTNNPRLTEKGERFGRQFVTFNPWQAYPELVVYLEKRDEDPEAQPECETIGGSE